MTYRARCERRKEISHKRIERPFWLFLEGLAVDGIIPRPVADRLAVFVFTFGREEALRCFTAEYRPSLGENLRSMLMYRMARRSGVALPFCIPSWEAGARS